MQRLTSLFRQVQPIPLLKTTTSRQFSSSGFKMASTDLSTWKMNHTMIRVKDPKRTIDFYSKLGLRVIDKVEQPAAKFDLYFLGYNYPTSDSGSLERSNREGLLELTHNYGTESDASYKISPGDDPLGFGHIGIAVDNIQAACKRLDDIGVTWHEKLEEGMPHRAFFKDPDGYQVEFVTEDHTATVNETTTNVETYRFNHTALRVKDPKVSLEWYQETLGMTLFRTIDRGTYTLYFLGYPGDKNPVKTENTNFLADQEGLVELIWTHGTEKQDGPVYHNGNKEPQGFGHLCVTVDDLQAACQHFEDKKVNWKKRLSDGRMRHIAFVLDPDEYWIEVIQNAKFKAPGGLQ